MAVAACLLCLPASVGCSSPSRLELPLYGNYEGHDSIVAAVVREPDLIPEGIAFDPKTRTLFLSSFRKSKIVAVDSEGRPRDFIAPHQHGFQAGVGLRVDARRRILWACSAAAPHMRDYDPDDPAETGVFQFDVDTGELLRNSVQPQASPGHIFNDVTLTREGDAYVSGFVSGKIYRIAAGQTEVEEFLALPTGNIPNGLDLSPDDLLLFVATGRDLLVVDPVTADWFPLGLPDGESALGIDGLYFHEDALIAVQSKRGYGEEGTRIVRFRLADTYDRVVAVEVLDEDHPLYDQPTTGVLDRYFLYYIANSQFTRFDEAFKLAPRSQLRDVAILKLRLD